MTAFVPGEVDKCTCIAWVMKRNKAAKAQGIPAANLASSCKHLQDVLHLTCQWKQDSLDDYRWDGKCPECGGPLVERDRPMIPEGAVGDEVEDLASLLAELKPKLATEEELFGPLDVGSLAAPATVVPETCATGDDEADLAPEPEARRATSDELYGINDALTGLAFSFGVTVDDGTLNDLTHHVASILFGEGDSAAPTERTADNVAAALLRDIA